MKNGLGLNSSARKRVIQIKSSSADVIMFSGSKDNQTSADTAENSRATGAMLYIFMNVLCNQPRQLYLSMLQNMRNELSGNIHKILSYRHHIQSMLIYNSYYGYY